MGILTNSSSVSLWNSPALLISDAPLCAHPETILEQSIYSTTTLDNKYKNTQCSLICDYLDRGVLIPQFEAEFRNLLEQAFVLSKTRTRMSKKSSV